MKAENRKLFIDQAEHYDRQYYNPPLALYGYQRGCNTPNQLAVIGAGTSDDMRLYRDASATVIYSANDSLEYMSIAVYEPGQGIVSDVFLDSESYRELERYQPINRAKAMLNYC